MGLFVTIKLQMQKRGMGGDDAIMLAHVLFCEQRSQVRIAMHGIYILYIYIYIFIIYIYIYIIIYIYIFLLYIYIFFYCLFFYHKLHQQKV